MNSFVHKLVYSLTGQVTVNALTYLRDPDNPNWIVVEGCGHVATVKRFARPDQFGIRGGRVSKLTIWRSGDECSLRTALYNFDRGPDFDRLDGAGRAFLLSLLDQLN